MGWPYHVVKIIAPYSTAMKQMVRGVCGWLQALALDLDCYNFFFHGPDWPTVYTKKVITLTLGIMSSQRKGKNWSRTFHACDVHPDPDPAGTKIICKLGSGSVINFGYDSGFGSVFESGCKFCFKLQIQSCTNVQIKKKFCFFAMFRWSSFQMYFS